LWKWDGNVFIDIAIQMPNTRYRTSGVTSFEIDGEAYLAFANRAYGQPKEIQKWNGNGFSSVTIPSNTNSVDTVFSLKI
jgi:hypothetical protein